MTEKPKCQLCGEPMPEGEEMFNYHGMSGPCPVKPDPARAAAAFVKENSNRLPDIREYDLKKAAEMMLGYQAKSTPVVGWYPHIYGDSRAQEMKTVRGPFGRWFCLMEGNDDGRNGKSQGCLADADDDIRHAAFALNNAASLAQGYLCLLEAVKDPEALKAADWKIKATWLQTELADVSEANSKKFDGLVSQHHEIERLNGEIKKLTEANDLLKRNCRLAE